MNSISSTDLMLCFIICTTILLVFYAIFKHRKNNYYKLAIEIPSTPSAKDRKFSWIQEVKPEKKVGYHNGYKTISEAGSLSYIRCRNYNRINKTILQQEIGILEDRMEKGIAVNLTDLCKAVAHSRNQTLDDKPYKFWTGECRRLIKNKTLPAWTDLFFDHYNRIKK